MLNNFSAVPIYNPSTTTSLQTSNSWWFYWLILGRPINVHNWTSFAICLNLTVNNRWRLNIYLTIGCRGFVAKYVENNRATNNTKLHCTFGFGQIVKRKYFSLQITRLSRYVEMSSFSLIQNTSRQCICKQLM